MPDETICPVVAAYIRETHTHWNRVGVTGLYDEVFDQLEELRSFAEMRLKDPSSQRVRAFHCLLRLFVLLSTRIGGPLQELPLTREGINKLIVFCSEARDREEVLIYTRELTPGSNLFDGMLRDSSMSLIGLTDTIVKAAEYLRPRLRNGATLSGMGRYLAVGLAGVKAPSDRFITHGRELINVSNVNKGELIP